MMLLLITTTVFMRICVFLKTLKKRKSEQVYAVERKPSARLRAPHPAESQSISLLRHHASCLLQLCAALSAALGSRKRYRCRQQVPSECTSMGLSYLEAAAPSCLVRTPTICAISHLLLILDALQISCKYGLRERCGAGLAPDRSVPSRVQRKS